MKIYCNYISEINWESKPELILKDHVHLWMIDVSSDEVILKVLTGTLNADEKIRSQKFVFENDRKQYITAHGALRQILGCYLSVNPAKIQFRKTNNHKPFISYPFTNIKFNITHSENKILIAISIAEIGVDIELIKPFFEFKEVINSYFSKKERSIIVNSINPSEIFYKLWTRKEAVLKASGIGISDYLNEIEVSESENLSAYFNYDLSVDSFKINNEFIASICYPLKIKGTVFYKHQL